MVENSSEARIPPRSPLGSLQRSLDPAGGLRLEGTGREKEGMEGGMGKEWRGELER